MTMMISPFSLRTSFITCMCPLWNGWKRPTKSPRLSAKFKASLTITVSADLIFVLIEAVAVGILEKAKVLFVQVSLWKLPCSLDFLFAESSI